MGSWVHDPPVHATKSTNPPPTTLCHCDIQFLDGKHTIFGEVAEGLDGVLKEINELYCDTNGRPYRCVSVFLCGQRMPAVRSPL